MTKPEEIIARYKKAYEEANGQAPQVDYWRGWYSVNEGFVQWKARASELIEAAKVFEALA